jgi:transposase InsO family protein
LAVVLDLYACKVVGWSMKATLDRELALDALLMPVWRRKPQQRWSTVTKAANMEATTLSASA